MTNHRWLVLTAFATTTLQAAWLPEFELTPDADSALARPVIAFGPNGRLHCTYHAQPPGASQLRMYYRYFDGADWSTPQDLPGPNNKEPQSAMVVDANGIVHVLGTWRWNNGANAYTIYYWNYNGTSWFGPQLVSSGSGDADCLNPNMTVDRFNNLHVVWEQGDQVGGGADIMYRRRRGSDGVWEAMRNVTSNSPGTSYGSVSPDIAVDRTGNNMHIAWHDDFVNDGFQAYYTKNTNLGDPASWIPSAQWFRLSTLNDNYGKSPTIAVDRSDYPHCVWYDRFGGSNNVTGYRRWTGSAWTDPANWGIINVHVMFFDTTNVMQYIYTNINTTPFELYWRTYNPATGSFSTAELVSSGPSTFKVDFAYLAVDANNIPWVVWEERKEPENRSTLYFSTKATLGAPGPVVSLTAVPSNTSVTLDWLNPGSPSYAGTMIRYKAGSFPTGPTDGTLLLDGNAARNSTGHYVHGGRTNGTNYCYAAFAHNSSGNYAGGTHAAAIPFGPADYDHDGDVDVADFGRFQLCMTGPYASQNDPDCLWAKLDGDSDVDDDDFTRFRKCISGPGVLANPLCVP